MYFSNLKVLDIIKNSQGCKFLETTKGGTIDMFDSITMEKSTNKNIYGVKYKL